MAITFWLTNTSSTVSAKKILGPLWTALCFFALGLLILSTSRLGLITWQSERVSNSYFTILLKGIRVDISSLCYLFAIPILVSFFYYLRNRNSLFLRKVASLWYISSICCLVYLEVITPTFISEYDLRPNRLLVEYLIYPNEVSSMLLSGYKVEICVSLASLIVGIFIAYNVMKRSWIPISSASVPVRLGLCILIFVLLILGARSSLGHRPMNPAMIAFSNDHLLNDLALNSSYSALFALKQMRLENSSSKFYGKMNDEEVIRIIRESTMKPFTEFTSYTSPTLTYRHATHKGKPKNLVILLQESLGARYVGGLGGLPLTPNIDKLMKEGWSFTNLYATGTRSVRGIEAIMTGFTPTPSRAVVKLDKSQKDFFTIAKFLKDNGYHTQFVYGGESHFDNMKSFFLGNGVTEIVDIDDFKKVDFKGSWGASDEDLYDQAHLEFQKLHKKREPFFSLVFTSSNHSPFEYPDNRISQFDDEKNTRNNAAKYSDFALGEFIKKAKRSSYWKDTIFLIVADHDSRVAGSSLVPINHFRIPGIILGEGIVAKKDNRLVSQIDLPPTLLSIIGVDGYMPMIGHDLTMNIPSNKQRALMQYDKNFAFMTNSEVTILQPHKAPIAFKYANEKLTLSSINESLTKRAKAHAIFGSIAYQKQWYQSNTQTTYCKETPCL